MEYSLNMLNLFQLLSGTLFIWLCQWRWVSDWQPLMTVMTSTALTAAIYAWSGHSIVQFVCPLVFVHSVSAPASESSTKNQIKPRTCSKRPFGSEAGAEPISGGIKGSMRGTFAPPSELLVPLPPFEEKMAKISHFHQFFLIFPSMPSKKKKKKKKKNLVLPLETIWTRTRGIQIGQNLCPDHS